MIYNNAVRDGEREKARERKGGGSLSREPKSVWFVDTPVWSQMQMAPKADHLIYEGHEYKTGPHALTCFLGWPHPRNQIAIRLISTYEREKSRGPFFKEEDRVPSLLTIRIHLPIGSPIILNDGPGARACQLSTWSVNLWPWETILGQSAERSLHGTDRYIYAVNLITSDQENIWRFDLIVFDICLRWRISISFHESYIYDRELLIIVHVGF